MLAVGSSRLDVRKATRIWFEMPKNELVAEKRKSQVRNRTWVPRSRPNLRPDPVRRPHCRRSAGLVVVFVLASKERGGPLLAKSNTARNRPPDRVFRALRRLRTRDYRWPAGYIHALTSSKAATGVSSRKLGAERSSNGGNCHCNVASWNTGVLIENTSKDSRGAKGLGIGSEPCARQL